LSLFSTQLLQETPFSLFLGLRCCRASLSFFLHPLAFSPSTQDFPLHWPLRRYFLLYSIFTLFWNRTPPAYCPSFPIGAHCAIPSFGAFYPVFFSSLPFDVPLFLPLFLPGLDTLFPSAFVPDSSDFVFKVHRLWPG